MLPEDPPVDVPDERFLDGLELPVRALDRGRAGDEGTRFRVAAEGPLERRRLLEDGEGLLDDLVVLARRAPAAAVLVQPRRLPGGEDVVLGMAVQVDQAGQDDAVGLDPGDAGTRRRGPDPRDRVAGDLDPAVLDHPVGRQDGPLEGERATGGDADGAAA